jgi:hypothetical protein
MQSIDLVLTLVFAVVMLLFMLYPAMKSAHWLTNRFGLHARWQTPLVFALTLLYSLGIGVFLRFF